MNDSDDRKQVLYAEGRAAFDAARFMAFVSEVRDVLLGRPVGLLSFDEIREKLNLSDQVYRGLRDIPVDSIVGSVGRYREFTRNFLPKEPNMVYRWSNVYAHMNDMTGVPPIDVFKVNNVYFVRDGNHRVSIARKMGQETIEAYVTELHTPIHLTPDMSRKEMDAATAYAQFLSQTRLDMNRPKQEAIQLSEASRYNDLLNHIYLVQRLLEHQRGYEVSFEYAAMRWYDTVYYPVIEKVREYNWLEQFPRRTEADLYVWVIGHLQHLMNVYGEDAEEANLSNALVDFLASHNIPVPKRLLTDDDKPLGS